MTPKTSTVTTNPVPEMGVPKLLDKINELIKEHHVEEPKLHGPEPEPHDHHELWIGLGASTITLIGCAFIVYLYAMSKRSGNHGGGDNQPLSRVGDIDLSLTQSGSTAMAQAHQPDDDHRKKSQSNVPGLNADLLGNVVACGKPNCQDSICVALRGRLDYNPVPHPGYCESMPPIYSNPGSTSRFAGDVQGGQYFEGTAYANYGDATMSNPVNRDDVVLDTELSQTYGPRGAYF